MILLLVVAGCGAVDHPPPDKAGSGELAPLYAVSTVPAVAATPPSVIAAHLASPGGLSGRADIVRGRAERWNLPDEVSYEATVLALARICVSEGGWENDRDCAGIYQVLRNTRRSDEHLIDVMRRHSRYMIPGRTSLPARQRWVTSLDLEGTRPSDLPDSASWERLERPWLRRIALARALIDGRVPDRPCPAPVIAWGGTMDDHIAHRRGLARVDCGDTENRFWARPGSVGQWALADRPEQALIAEPSAKPESADAPVPEE